MRALRCLVGRHAWAAERNPEKGGAAALTLVCVRCGHEKPEYEVNDGSSIATAAMRGPGLPL